MIDETLIRLTTQALLLAESRPPFIQKILDEMGKYMIVEGQADERWTFVVGYIASNQDLSCMTAFLRGTRRIVKKWNPWADLGPLDDAIVQWESEHLAENQAEAAT